MRNLHLKLLCSFSPLVRLFDERGALRTKGTQVHLVHHNFELILIESAVKSTQFLENL